MSIGALITRGYGSFSTIPLLLLHGYGDFQPAPVGGGAIWPRTAPPDGYRSVLDTAGVDIAADERRRLDALRRELGVIKDVDAEPDEVPFDIPLPIPAPLEAITAPVFDKMSYAEFVAAARIAAARKEEAERVEWLRQDDEDVLILVAGGI